MTEAPLPISRALISVSDKTGIIDFCRFLEGHKVEIISTGGTAAALRDAGITVKEVAAHTGFPEIMDGRVRTLHPLIHGGILARRDETSHLDAMTQHGIAPIDLLVVNLYPFQATVERGASIDACIENIDIGGPALIRAAAKNHDFVTVVTDPSDYPTVMAEMETGGTLTKNLRRRLAAKAFARTATYDAAISGWFTKILAEDFPPQILVSGVLKEVLRYGENPHQQAAFYTTSTPREGVASAQQIQGKQLSWNNLNDTDAAFELVSEFQAPRYDQPAVAIVKHANPCGVALGSSLRDAYEKALASDPVSAFGGIVALNRPLDGPTAEAIAKLFAEVVIAPGIDEAARAALKGKTNLRILLTSGLADPAATDLTVRGLAGSLLVQTSDRGHVLPKDMKVVTRRPPTPQEWKDLLFAFTVAKHVKSNAIVYARDGATVGIGAGQMSRVDSSRTAAFKAAEAARVAGLSESKAIGSAVASDAFFPFADGLMAAVEAGATAAIQPGGSVRDAEVVAAADKAGIAMVFTGMRHFRH
ncbi:MAG: bifunctional phosphoribosylaminoimidazolecarboxamide formyltransferase/IMP cyclohydrolase [Alphaproteobacteria bacterium]